MLKIKIFVFISLGLFSFNSFGSNKCINNFIDSFDIKNQFMSKNTDGVTVVHPNFHGNGWTSLSRDPKIINSTNKGQALNEVKFDQSIMLITKNPVPEGVLRPVTFRDIETIDWNNCTNCQTGKLVSVEEIYYTSFSDISNSETQTTLKSTLVRKLKITFINNLEVEEIVELKPDEIFLVKDLSKYNFQDSN